MLLSVFDEFRFRLSVKSNHVGLTNVDGTMSLNNNCRSREIIDPRVW